MKPKQKDSVLYKTPFESRGYFVKSWCLNLTKTQHIVRFYPSLDNLFKHIKINKNQIIE